jgi:hypothetical protein
MDVILDWTAFKSFFITRSANPQYIETSTKYYIYAFDGRLDVRCELIKDPSDTTDLNDWVNNYKSIANAVVPFTYQSPFSSKKLAVGGSVKNLFARNTGKRFTLTASTTTECVYTATFPWVKMTGIECIGGEVGDYADLKVYDTPTGTYSGVPNLQLNQFGYEVNIAPGLYSRSSSFDSDLYVGMIIKLFYYSISNKTVGINFLMNEVKS